MHSSPFKSLRGRIALAALLGVLACGRPPGEEALAHLPGYWEIEAVEFPNGESRDYAANSAIDYYHLEGRKGYLKKLQPEANGRYLASDDALPLEVLSRNGRLYLRFEGEESAWEEEVLELGPDHLITRHENGLHYRYRRYVPLQIPQS